MHLLATRSGVIDDGDEAVDLAQTPGDVAVVSAADSELSALARAHDGLGDGAPDLRLANQMQLRHNLSVDVYLERTLKGAKLVVLRLLGGKAYWSYGLEQVCEAGRGGGFKLAVLPGDGQPDPDLMALSTLPENQTVRLWRYLVEGGPRNMRNFLAYCGHLLDARAEPAPPAPLLKSGLYWPGIETPSIDDLKKDWTEGAPVAAITFYRALVEGGNVAPVDALISTLAARGLNALPIFVAGLKDPASAAAIEELFAAAAPSVILNGTGFAVAAHNAAGVPDPLGASDCPVLQVVFSGSSREAWEANPQGLSARDLAMNVVLPELDGRVLTRAVSFKSNAERHEATQCDLVIYAPEPDRVAFVADLAANWVKLRETAPADRKIAIVLANYPNRDGRIGNGVGYDAPASAVRILDALAEAGYRLDGVPPDGDALIRELLKGPTNDLRTVRRNGVELALEDYRLAYERLPSTARNEIEGRWGRPEDDPFVRSGAFRLGIVRYGNVAIGIQPARGYNIDPKGSYHDPALPPPHGYLAFHVWLRNDFRAHAIVHNGKHGNLEWLPGKALALGAACHPEAILGPTPNVYPFIVNDPGEGTQAKRRTSAVIVDHLTPPLTRAETYGPLKDLESLIDEYYLASGLDRRRVDLLREHILELTRSSGLDEDAGVKDLRDEEALQRIDNYICELKEAQIRDGLHILGESPRGRLRTDLLVALARTPRNLGKGGDASLIRALADDFGFEGFDPLRCVPGTAWEGAKPRELADLLPEQPWRTCGDAVERLEAMATLLVEGAIDCDERWTAASEVLTSVREDIRPALDACGPDEMRAMVAALDGRFVAPGPSGAPTRGRTDVLPTGRNFFSVDNRTVPTPVAWSLGEKSARLLVERFLQDHGRWPEAMGLSVWGTSNMRTGGDDVAQALALIGVRPEWDHSSWRVTGFEIVPLAKLGRPRVDVTLRVSGFFRDAFPAQMDLFDSAARAVGALEEDAADNPIAARMGADRARLERDGLDPAEAARCAGFRVFGSKPGAYGAGLQTLIDERLWESRSDLAESYIDWGGYAYGGGARGVERRELFRRRLSGLQAVVHNQDNREHDLLDSDDYYQFEGGMTAAVEHVNGERPSVYHNDHSRPERPVVRTLEEEIGRVVRSRVVNPKWIAGVMRHGYKGAFEIAATVDYMFAFAATTGAVRGHHFQLAYDAFLGDDEVCAFIREKNAPALREMSERFREAIDRGLWTPRSNSAYHRLYQPVDETIEEPA